MKRLGGTRAKHPPRKAPSLPRLAPKISLSEWAHLHAHLVWIYDGPIDPQWHHFSTLTPNHAAWLIRRGRVEVTQGERSWRANAGEWIFLPHGACFQHFTPDARILSVRFRAAWPTGEDLFNEGLGIVIPASDYPALERAAVRLLRFVARRFPATTVDLMQAHASLQGMLRLQGLFSQWLETTIDAFLANGLVPSRMGKMDPRLLQAVRALDRQALSAPPREPEVAGAVGLSVSQLNRLFKRHFGVSSHGYFEQRRFRHAVASLESSPRSIKEVAHGLGFSSLPHFSAWFSRWNGASPRSFRQQSQDKKR